MSKAIISHLSNSNAEGSRELSSMCGCVNDAEVPAPQLWYILRYKTLSASVKDGLLKNGVEVFLPYSRKKYVDPKTKRVECIDKPLIPSYVFVQTSFEKAKSLGNEFGLNLWKRRFKYADDLSIHDGDEDTSEQRLYHTVSDLQMTYFKRAVEIYKQDLVLSDMSEIDLQQNDQVEIISGEFKGVRGYLKTSQGKDGGIVVVPVSFEKGKPKEGLCYSIVASAHEIGIIAFADGKRHASDCIRSAQQMVEKAMKQFVDGEELSDEMRKQLLRYIARFKDTKFKTDKLKANHLMLMLQIYTLLENPTLREVILEEIQQDVLPAFDARIAEAKRRGRPDGSGLKEKYLEQISRADEVRTTRLQKLNMQQVAKPVSATVSV